MDKYLSVFREMISLRGLTVKCYTKVVTGVANEI